MCEWFVFCRVRHVNVKLKQLSCTHTHTLKIHSTSFKRRGMCRAYTFLLYLRRCALLYIRFCRSNIYIQYRYNITYTHGGGDPAFIIWVFCVVRLFRRCAPSTHNYFNELCATRERDYGSTPPTSIEIGLCCSSSSYLRCRCRRLCVFCVFVAQLLFCVSSRAHTHTCMRTVSRC